MRPRAHTFLPILPFVLGVGLAPASCGKVQPGGAGDASPGDGGTTTTGAAGHGGAGGSGGAAAGGSGHAGSSGSAGAGGSGGAGTGGSGGSGTGGGGGATCGSKTCSPGGKCCYACISLCAGPGETCPQFIRDPCSDVDAGAAQSCTDKSPACPSGQVCDLSQPGRCVASTTGGTCITKPTVCPQIYVPVCGCDGKTYGTDCARQMAGAQLDHDGACAGTACGTATCASGEICVHPCCGGAPPLPGTPACTPPPPFCRAELSCSTQSNNACCFSDAGAGCCGLPDKGTLICLCA